MVKNIIPKIAPVIVSIGAFAIPDSISWDTSLSYLNFGFVDGIHTTSLGYLLQYTLNSNKWIQFPNLIIFPTLILVIISFSFFLLCHRISDSLNPKNHNKVYSAITRRRRK
jgi:oligopeptide transport system permease protein